MGCDRCNELLAAYKGAVGGYTTAERKIRGLIADGFHLALKEFSLAQDWRGCSCRRDEAVAQDHHGARA